MNKTISLIILLFIIASLFHISVLNINLNPYDESVILVGAERILEGEVPYKDFFSQYTPGQYYVLTAVFKIFGISVIAERIYDIIIKSFLSLVVFLIIRLLSSNKYAVTGWIMSLFWSGYINFPAYPVYPSLLFILISVYLFQLHFKEKKIFYINLCAIAIVIAVFFRHDLGGMAALAITFVLTIQRILKIRLSWTPLAYYIGCGLAVGIPVILYFFLFSDIDAVISNLIIFPLSEFQAFQSIPYPTQLSLFTIPFFIFPLVVFIGLITALIFMRRKADHATTYGILLISLIGIAFFKQASARSDIVHLMPVGLMSILLAPVLLSAIPKELSFGTLQHRLLGLLFIAVLGIALYKPISMRIKAIPDKYAIKVINPDMERIKYTQLRDADIKKVVTYIKNKTSKSDYIYSGLKDHDELLFNNALIYFLAERKCATKYHEMNPGFTTTLKIQEEIVHELKERDVRLLVLISGLWNAELIPVKQPIDVLDNYVFGNYQLQETFGDYEIWIRKP